MNEEKERMNFFSFYFFKIIHYYGLKMNIHTRD
jgi:hypothetical protein